MGSNNAGASNQKTICQKIFGILAKSPARRPNPHRAPPQTAETVPIIFDHTPARTGGNKQRPTRKRTSRRDSFNSKASDYINRTKIRFAMPSFVENGGAAPFPEGFERE